MKTIQWKKKLLVVNFVYLTIDEVNAARMKRHFDCVVHEPRDGPWPYDRPLIVDLDFLAATARTRKELIDQLIRHASTVPVGIHSQNLMEEERDRLKAAGVLVSRRLTRRLVCKICSAPPIPVCSEIFIG